MACVHAQELLDYLKQFDKDGKGGLSKEELQEVMKGRMRCVCDSTMLGSQGGIPIAREVNINELMKLGDVEWIGVI